jgi:hypothetical protein
MPSVPIPPDFNDGTSSAAQLNQLRDAIRFALKPPNAMLRQTSAQTLTNNVANAIQFNTHDFDIDVDNVGGHDDVTNNTRYTARYPGIYAVSGGITFAANATGVRLAWLRKNGVDINSSSVELPACGGGLVTGIATRSVEVYLAEGDYVELIALENSGSNLLASVNPSEQPHMAICWRSLT